MVLREFSKSSAPPGAFSLVETLLSASIVSGALLTILALFSSGLSIARESTRITYSALLARKVAEELSFVPSVPVHSFEPLPLYGNMAMAKMAPEPMPQIESSQVRFYTAFLESVGIISNGKQLYDNGSQDLNAVYLVLVEETNRDDLGPGVKQLQINVEFPASAQAQSRKVHRFSTLVHKP